MPLDVVEKIPNKSLDTANILVAKPQKRVFRKKQQFYSKSHQHRAR